jgi:hypothetical protein
MVGERVQSLKSMLHWRVPLTRGSEGIVECVGRTADDVVVNFNNVSAVVKLHQICRPGEFAQSFGTRVGQYIVGDRVRCLRNYRSWRPQPVRLGDVGVVECYGSTEATLIVNFGSVAGELSFADVCRNHGIGFHAEQTQTLQHVISILPDEVLIEKGYSSCAICLGDMLPGETCRRLPCLHTFHSECLDEWLQRKQRCPLDNLDLQVMLKKQRDFEAALNEVEGYAESKA